MSQESYFSIVIPTRNRAQLLSFALQSALAQDFDDYEIVVSDNCSLDNTAQVVKDLQTGRVRYVRVDRPLSMPDHWEFALDQANGQYVIFLSDDDALTKDALRRVAGTIERHKTKLVALFSAIYYGANWFDPASRNVVVLNPHTGSELECDSRETLTQIFNSRVLYQAPRMINSFCHRETMLRVRAESKRMFLMCPDYSFAAFMLTEVPSWIYLDQPLHIQGVFAEGIGSTQYYNRGEPSREFLREFDETKLLKRVPMEVPVVTNYIAETLLMCKERMSAKLANYQINQEQYFIGCWQELLLHEHNGVAVDDDKEELLTVLSQQPQPLQQAVLAVIRPPEPVVIEQPEVSQNPVKQFARRIISRSPALMNFESFVRQRQVADESVVQAAPALGPQPIVFQGELAGFDNIFECATKLSELVRNNPQAPNSRPITAPSSNGR